MRRFQVSTVLLLGTLAAFLTGCSKNPVSPELSSPAPGGASMGAVQVDDTPPPVSGGIPSEAQGQFDSASEGRLTAGRFTLDLHKNSLKMPATITLRVSNADAMDVEIEVVPAEANDFQVPVQLSANLSDKPNTNYDTAWMFYREGGAWEEGTDVSAHPNQKNVVAKMVHLSACLVDDHDGNGKKKMTE